MDHPSPPPIVEQEFDILPSASTASKQKNDEKLRKVGQRVYAYSSGDPETGSTLTLAFS